MDIIEQLFSSLDVALNECPLDYEINLALLQVHNAWNLYKQHCLRNELENSGVTRLQLLADMVGEDEQE